MEVVKIELFPLLDSVPLMCGTGDALGTNVRISEVGSRDAEVSSGDILPVADAVELKINEPSGEEISTEDEISDGFGMNVPWAEVGRNCAADEISEGFAMNVPLADVGKRYPDELLNAGACIVADTDLVLEACWAESVAEECVEEDVDLRLEAELGLDDPEVETDLELDDNLLEVEIAALELDRRVELVAILELLLLELLIVEFE